MMDLFCTIKLLRDKKKMFLWFGLCACTINMKTSLNFSYWGNIQRKEQYYFILFLRPGEQVDKHVSCTDLQPEAQKLSITSV